MARISACLRSYHEDVAVDLGWRLNEAALTIGPEEQEEFGVKLVRQEGPPRLPVEPGGPVTERGFRIVHLPDGWFVVQSPAPLASNMDRAVSYSA